MLSYTVLREIPVADLAWLSIARDEFTVPERLSATEMLYARIAEMDESPRRERLLRIVARRVERLSRTRN